MAVVRSSDFLRASKRATALATLVRQRRLTPSCGEHASTAERTVGPARMIVESLTPRPGIREHNRRQSRSGRRTLKLTCTTLNVTLQRSFVAAQRGSVHLNRMASGTKKALTQIQPRSVMVLR